MKLLIVRHADPDYSIDSLTPTGWKEAALLAERLSRLEVAAFYVSPLGRAKDTASLTLKKMGRTATECPWLREFSAPIHKPGAEGESIPWDWLPTGPPSPAFLTGTPGWKPNPCGPGTWRSNTAG